MNYDIVKTAVSQQYIPCKLAKQLNAIGAKILLVEQTTTWFNKYHGDTPLRTNPENIDAFIVFRLHYFAKWVTLTEFGIGGQPGTKFDWHPLPKPSQFFTPVGGGGDTTFHARTMPLTFEMTYALLLKYGSQITGEDLVEEGLFRFINQKHHFEN